MTILPAGATKPIPVPFVQGWTALLPDDLPNGPAVLTVTAVGQTFGPLSLTIVPSSFGLFTQDSGSGPVLAQNSLTHPAKPGDYLTLWGTGLGSAPQDQVEVLLGGHPARVTYAGPAPGYAGTDQINFQVPNDAAIPFGCYVAISVVAAGVGSNTGTLSTSADGSPCQSPLGFTVTQLAQLDAGQFLSVGQVNLYDMVGPPESQSSTAAGFTRMESADAAFLSVNAAGAGLLVDPLEADDAYYVCYSVAAGGVGFLLRTGSIGEGAVLSLSNGSKSVSLTSDVEIADPPSVTTPDAVGAPFFAEGNWTVGITGGDGLKPATGELAIPQPLQITNDTALPTVDRSRDLTVTWNGGDYTAAYTASLQLNAASVVVICRAPANAGTITMPAALLQTLTAEAGSLELLLTARTGHIASFPVPLIGGGTMPDPHIGGGTMPVLLQYYPSEVLPVAIR